MFKIQKNKCIRKFNNLLAAKNNSFNNFNGFNSFNNLASNFDNNNWLKNLSDVEIPVNVKKVLVLGPKHALCAPRNFITSPKFIASVESGLMKINDENTQTTTRIRMVNKILNFTTNQSKINNPLLSKSEIIETRTFFQENNNLLVLKSDKGNTTVLVSKDFYNMEVMKMLNDETTYTVSRFEYTCTFERRSNSIVSNMVKKQQISEQMGKHLKTYNSIVPRAYAPPKIHKETLSWRIIVSSINGPTYKLSSFLANILSKIVGKSPYHTVDSWQFCKEIRNIHLPYESLRLVSLDVVSLFTNVPVDLAIQVLHHRWTEIEQHTKIDRDGFLQAVKFVLESNIFLFNGVFYKQVFGTAMGSPISPVIANIVMERLEMISLSKVPFQPILYKRYVDDIITCINLEDLQTFLDTFNSFHNRLQFTYEIEEDSCLNFLDTWVIRSNNKLITNWYHKPSWSGRYINFISAHPMQHKVGLIKGLIDRAVLLADPEFRPANLLLVKDTLKRNSYPGEMISAIIRERIFEIYHPFIVEKRKEEKTRKTGPISWKNTVVIPFINNISNDIKRIFKKAGIHTIFKLPFYSKCLFPPIKDKISLLKNSNIVYSIPCMGCNQVYIGQTSRLLEKRIYEHKRNIFSPPLQHTALTKHSIEFDHRFDYNNVKVVDKETKLNQRILLETLHMIKQPSVNLRYETPKMHNYYATLLKE